ncbi:LysR substrate-binding domain-containing protein [Sphingomonas sp. MMS24-JH45]
MVHRTTRRLTLTGAGERFRDDLLPVMAALASAEARLTDAHHAPAGPLRVTAPTSFGRLHVAPHLHRFLSRRSAVALSLDLSDGFVELPSPRVDVAVRIAATVPAPLVAHRLAASRRVLCAAPAYLAHAGLPAAIGDLARHRLLAGRPVAMAARRGSPHGDGGGAERGRDQLYARSSANSRSPASASRCGRYGRG